MNRILTLVVLFALAAMLLPAQIPTPFSAQITVYPWQDPATVEYPVQPVIDIGAFKYEVRTGKLSLLGKDLPFTFEYGIVLSPFDRYGNRTLTMLNPLQLATVATANDCLKWVKSFAPADAQVSVTEDPRISPFGFSAVERSIVVYGKAFNAGLIAMERIIVGDEMAKAYLSLQFAAAKNAR